MPKIQTNCPRCKSPLMADVEQLFDLGMDPEAKQKLLSGMVNVIHCPSCGYEGMVSTPIVYHDPEKELLLTFFPSELGLPLNEQERMFGPIINQVVNNLPMEKRKGYLLRPQSMLTFQTMVERILEGDGITKQMIEDQQKRLQLLQRIMMTANKEDRATIIAQEKDLIDESFFSMLSRLIEATLAQGDERTARGLAGLQQELVEQTEVGQRLAAQTAEVQQTIQKLQEASKEGLTREKLIELMVEAPSEAALSTLVSLVRNGLDYQFFQILTERIEKSEGETKQKLEALRVSLLDFTKKMDEQIQVEKEARRKLINQIMTSANVEAAMEQNLDRYDELFAEILQEELKIARKLADLDRISRLNRMAAVIEKASAPPPEFAFIEELLSVPSGEERQKKMAEKSEMVTSEFVELLANLVAQTEAQQQPAELVDGLKDIHRMALRQSMVNNLKK